MFNKSNYKHNYNSFANSMQKHRLLLLVLLLITCLCVMTYISYKDNFDILSSTRTARVMNEGFTSSKKLKSEYSNKHTNTKFKNMKKKKKDPFDTDIDFKYYGTTDFKKQLPKHKASRLLKLKLENNNTYKDTKSHKELKKHKDSKEPFNDTLSLLKAIDDDTNPGKYDRFQNILDEVDKIDEKAFSFTSMNEALRSYNDNINNRMKYAKKKSLSNFEGTISQGSILIDELKKLFSYDSYF